MERSQAHAARQEAAKGARGVESRGNFLIRGQFFLRADNAPDLRLWTLSTFLKSAERSRNIQLVGSSWFSEGTTRVSCEAQDCPVLRDVYHACFSRTIISLEAPSGCSERRSPSAGIFFSVSI